MEATLTVNLPSQVSYQGYHVDRGPGCSNSGQTVNCNLDFFPPGQTATVQIGARVTATGTATLTTSTYSSPQEYDPTNSAISFTITIGTASAPTPSPTPVPVGKPAPVPATAAILSLGALKPVLLDVKRPTLALKLKTSKTTKLTIKLLLKTKLIAAWHETARKGTDAIKLLLPPKARHAGHYKLELLQTGAKTAKTSAVIFK